ncbi:MAG: hypothetical protein JSR30_10935 [Proteobacteria bacterium]|nr:hypothetical protein [Pseudomonadota bacterium]
MSGVTVSGVSGFMAALTLATDEQQVSVQAHVGAADVKPRSGGRSQNR